MEEGSLLLGILAVLGYNAVKNNGGVPPATWWGLKRLLKFVAIIWFVLVLLAMFGGMISRAYSQTTNRTFQDSMGRNIGRSSTDTRGNTTFYDSMGRNTGRSSTQNGTTTFYNERGQQTGRSNK